MNKSNCYSTAIFFALSVGLLSMGANCPGCMISKECKSYKNNKVQCQNDKRCDFNEKKKLCHERSSELMSGCFDIVEEEACKASKDCTFDSMVRACTEAPNKGACNNIQSEKACNSEEHCLWHDEQQSCVNKK